MLIGETEDLDIACRIATLFTNPTGARLDVKPGQHGDK